MRRLRAASRYAVGRRDFESALALFDRVPEQHPRAPNSPHQGANACRRRTEAGDLRGEAITNEPTNAVLSVRSGT
jgi:hypothetical protein